MNIYWCARSLIYFQGARIRYERSNEVGDLCKRFCSTRRRVEKKVFDSSTPYRV